MPIDGGCTALRLISPQGSFVSSTPQHQALYRRWRSQRFAEVVGQDAVVMTLRNAIRTGRSAHAYLFVGPRGTGKTSLARIVAKAVNCPNIDDGEPCDTCPSCDAIREGRALDVVELDAASNNRVDDIRELLPRIYTAPADLPTQGLHRRRGPADHPGLGRPAQDPRGAASARPVHLLHHGQQPDPSRRGLTRAALRLPAASAPPDRGQAEPDPRRRRPHGDARGRRARRAPRRRRHARRGVDPRPAAVRGR